MKVYYLNFYLKKEQFKNDYWHFTLHNILNNERRYMKTLQIRNRRINSVINYLKYTMISYSNHSHKTYNLKEMLTFIMAFLQFHLEYVKIQRQ